MIGGGGCALSHKLISCERWRSGLRGFGARTLQVARPFANFFNSATPVKHKNVNPIKPLRKPQGPISDIQLTQTWWLSQCPSLEVPRPEHMNAGHPVCLHPGHVGKEDPSHDKLKPRIRPGLWTMVLFPRQELGLNSACGFALLVA